MTVYSALISSAHRILTGRTDDGGHAAGSDIRIVNGRVHAIGKPAPLPGESVLDATGCGMVADHHYLYHPDMPYDSSAILFEEAEALGLRFVLCRGGATQTRQPEAAGVKVSIGVDGAALNEAADMISETHAARGHKKSCGSASRPTCLNPARAFFRSQDRGAPRENLLAIQNNGIRFSRVQYPKGIAPLVANRDGNGGRLP